MRLAHATTGLGIALLLPLSNLDLGGGLASRVKVDLYWSSTLSGETFDSAFSAADLRLVIVAKLHVSFGRFHRDSLGGCVHFRQLSLNDLGFFLRQCQSGLGQNQSGK